MMQAQLEQRVIAYLEALEGSESTRIQEITPRAMPPALRGMARAGWPPSRPPAQAGELWRVAPGALMWIEQVDGELLRGYLVYDEPALACPDELIIPAWLAPGGEELVLCLWRRLCVPASQALGRLGALPDALRLQVVWARRGAGAPLELGPDTLQWWEREEAGHITRWQTGPRWLPDDPRRRVQRALRSRTATIEEGQRSLAALVLEAARAVATRFEQLYEWGSRAIPPLELGAAATRLGEEPASGDGLVEFVVELDDAKIALCLEERAGALELSVQALRGDQPVAGALIHLTAGEAALELRTDADGLAEGRVEPCAEGASVCIQLGAAQRVILI